MKIIIVGAGEIGRHLATSLSLEAHSISVIEFHASLARELEDSLDARVLNADGTEVEVLIEAGVASCDLFLALTSHNSVNIIACSLAKKMGAKKVISRVHPGVQREEWLFDYRGHFGIDHLFSSERLSAIALAKFIRNPDCLAVEEIARGRIELQQVRIADESDVSGQEIRALKLPERTRLASVSRGGDHFIPKADTELLGGDVVTVFGEPRKLRTLSNRLQGGKGENSSLRVVIFGGGEYGFTLAQMLESWNFRVRIFEKDPERARELTDKLANTTVINVDGTVLAELEEEQVGEADFFVACSGSDEDNVMTCLQANTLGAGNCLTLIHRADYADAISGSGKHFGMLAAVSPRDATAREINRFITSERFHVIKELDAGDVVETVIGKGSSVAGQAIEDVEWPQGCVLVARLQGVHADVPGPLDVLSPGDTVYAMVNTKARKAFLKLVSS